MEDKEKLLKQIEQLKQKKAFISNLIFIGVLLIPGSVIAGLLLWNIGIFIVIWMFGSLFILIGGIFSERISKKIDSIEVRIARIRDRKEE